jgi:hypothetical protein
MTEFVRVAHPDLDDQAEVAAESLPAWEARGWQAVSEPRSLSRAQDEETIRAQQEAVEAEKARAKAEEMAGARVDQILKKVGQDPVLAAEALKVENERPQPRVTLVAELERIAGNAAGSDPRTAAADTEE